MSFVRALQKGFQENKAPWLLHILNFWCIFTQVLVYQFKNFPSNSFLPIQALWSRWTIQLLLIIQVWRDEPPVPSSSKMLHVKGLKISRTYCEVSREFGTIFSVTSQQDQKSLMKWCLRPFHLHGDMDFGTNWLCCLVQSAHAFETFRRNWLEPSLLESKGIHAGSSWKETPPVARFRWSMPNLWHERVKCALKES